MQRFKLIPQSKDSKLTSSAIPAMYAEKATCPNYCPFFKKCYAKKGNVAFTFNRFDKVENYGGSWDEFCNSVKTTLKHTKLRLNVSGDLPSIKDRLDHEALKKLAKIVKRNKVKTWGYTHRKNSENIIKDVNSDYLTINRSVHTEKTAIKYQKDGVPVALALPKNKVKKNSWSKDNVKFQVCPNQINDNVKCDTCMLCADSNRDKVVVFIEH